MNPGSARDFIRHTRIAKNSCFIPGSNPRRTDWRAGALATGQTTVTKWIISLSGYLEENLKFEGGKEYIKPRTAQVGATSKVQKEQKDFKVSSILFYSTHMRTIFFKSNFFFSFFWSGMSHSAENCKRGPQKKA